MHIKSLTAVALLSLSNCTTNPCLDKAETTEPLILKADGTIDHPLDLLALIQKEEIYHDRKNPPPFTPLERAVLLDLIAETHALENVTLPTDTTISYTRNTIMDDSGGGRMGVSCNNDILIVEFSPINFLRIMYHELGHTLQPKPTGCCGNHLLTDFHEFNQLIDTFKLDQDSGSLVVQHTLHSFGNRFVGNYDILPLIKNAYNEDTRLADINMFLTLDAENGNFTKSRTRIITQTYENAYKDVMNFLADATTPEARMDKSFTLYTRVIGHVGRNLADATSPTAVRKLANDFSLYLAGEPYKDQLSKLSTALTSKL